MGDDGPRPTEERTVVVVRAGTADAELLADRCFTLGASAVGEVAVDDDTVELTADLPTAALAEALAALPGARTVEVDPSVAARWRDHLGPVVVADRLVVRPPWCASPDAAPSSGVLRIEVVVDPGDAFGAATHPTTVGCLAALVALADGGALADASVLDVGCGTGVLALAALALGAAQAVGVDTDPAAVAAADHNARLNGAADRFEVRPGSLAAAPPGPADGRFDVVLANLLAPVFDELGGALAETVAPGGSLVVSGLLAAQLDRAVAPAEVAGLELGDVALHGDWVVGVLRRPVHTPVTDR